MNSRILNANLSSILRLSGWLCVLMMLSGGALAQDANEPSSSKVERKNRAPVSREILRVNLPKPFESKLGNGLTVLVVEDHRAPFISSQLHIGGAGGLYEPDRLRGVASMTARMLREGTGKRDSVQLAEEIDRLGASISASTSFGSTEAVVHASGLKENFAEWFAIAVDMLLSPSFPADELAKLKQRQLAHLRQQRSSPGFLVSERFDDAVYGDHPAATITYTPESLSAIDRNALVRWHRERYSPHDAILAIAGDVKAKDLLPQLERLLGHWRGAPGELAWPTEPWPTASGRVYLVHRPDSVQTTVALGNIAVDRRSADYLPMTVMNHILGAGASGRLFLNLREEKGYTYGVYSYFTAVRYPGPWRAGGNMRTEVTAPALGEFYKEINRMRDEPVTREELEASKRAIAASFALALEQPSSILNFAIVAKYYGFPPDYWDQYPERIMEVTATDVRRVARKYLDPMTMQLVAVGDGEKIKSVLEKYGPVAVYDQEGQPIQMNP